MTTPDPRAQRDTLDLDDIKPWLNICGGCDAGLPMSCTCPDGDPRPVMARLVAEIERQRGELAEVTRQRDEARAERDAMTEVADRNKRDYIRAVAERTEARAELAAMRRVVDTAPRGRIDRDGDLWQSDGDHWYLSGGDHEPYYRDRLERDYGPTRHVALVPVDQAAAPLGSTSPAQEPDADLVETLSRAAHDAWMESKRAQGIASRRSEWGEELMAPYADLSEQARDLDRGTVRGVLAAVERAGYAVMAAVPSAPAPAPDAWAALDEAMQPVLAQALIQALTAAPAVPSVPAEDGTHEAQRHFSPGCGCGINDAGQRYVDPICAALTEGGSTDA